MYTWKNIKVILKQKAGQIVQQFFFCQPLMVLQSLIFL